MYQILSESTDFCGRYNKNILVFFSVHSVASQFNEFSKIIVDNTLDIVNKSRKKFIMKF